MQQRGEESLGGLPRGGVSARTRSIVLALACAAFVFGCGREDEAPAARSAPAASSAPAAELPATIVAERGGFIPEGVEFDQTSRRFLVGSLREGTVFVLHTDGQLTPLVTDPDLVSSVGIEVDEPRDRLLVANSDARIFEGEKPGQAKLGVYVASTGVRIAMVDLAAAIQDAPPDAVFFANDVTVGDDGTAYVTDTRMNVIYQVDTSYRASVLHRFEPAEHFRLNGLVYHPSGYLLVVSNAELYKVPLADPTTTQRVKLPEPVPGADGVVWMPDGRLAIVSNSTNRVLLWKSRDNWASAEAAGVAKFGEQATTAAVVDDALYVVHPHFTDDEPPSLERVRIQ